MEKTTKNQKPQGMTDIIDLVGETTITNIERTKPMESFLTGFWTTTGVIAGLTIFLVIGAVINAILGD